MVDFELEEDDFLDEDVVMEDLEMFFVFVFVFVLKLKLIIIMSGIIGGFCMGGSGVVVVVVVGWKIKG